MPEQLTKHPEVTLQVLRSAGAQCAEGFPQDILTSCPTERFCKLPGGEICVFGLGDASKMTQITSTEWRAILPAALPESSSMSEPFMSEALLSGGLGLLAGVTIGVALWRLHMGFTQGLLATLVADRAVPELRGTAYGVFNLLCGVAMLVASVVAGSPLG